MTDRREEENIREEIRRSQAVPRRGSGLKRVLMVLLVLIAVLAAVVAAAWKDLSGLDSVRRLFSYNNVTQDEQGKVELYSFSNDRSNTFALLGDHLIVASTTGVSIYSSSGSVVDSMSVKLTNPAIAVGGQTAAVYDIGGQTLLIYSASGLVRDMSGECSGSILSVSVNPSDYLALNAEKSGYKSAVTVYDASGEKVFAFNSSERYVIDAVVMRDCKRMAAVTLGESGGSFADTVNIYSLGSEKADSVNTLTGSLLLSLDSVAGTLSCLTDEGLTLFSANGTLAGSYRYEYPYLRGSSMGGDSFAVLLSSAAEELTDPIRKRIMEQILYHLGRWIYLIDGADDLKKDAESGNYNPVALRYGLTDGTWTPESRRDFATTLDHSIHQMAAAFELWDFGVWTPVLQSTFYGGLFQVGKAVLDGSFHRPSRKNIREFEETE